MSTRAIARVVGVSHKTVVKDSQVVPRVPPAVDYVTGEVPQTYPDHRPAPGLV